MPIARSGTGSVVLPDGRIMLPGGPTVWPYASGNYSTSVLIYNPASDTWAVKGGDPAGINGTGGAFGAINGTIYYAGGNDANGNVINTTRAASFLPSTDITKSFSGVSNVTSNGVTLGLTSGASSGVFVVSTTSSAPAAAPFRVVSPYYDLATSALYSGNVIVTVPYNKASVTGNPSNLRLYHWNGSSWDNITTSVDTVNGTITGTTSSLSPFEVGEAVSTPIRATNPIALLTMALAAGVLIFRKKVFRQG
jgi:hypothetical protein